MNGQLSFETRDVVIAKANGRCECETGCFRLQGSSMWIEAGCAPSANMPSYVHETEENIIAVFIRQRTGLHVVILCAFVKI